MVCHHLYILSISKDSTNRRAIPQISASKHIDRTEAKAYAVEKGTGCHFYRISMNAEGGTRWEAGIFPKRY